MVRVRLMRVVRMRLVRVVGVVRMMRVMGMWLVRMMRVMWVVMMGAVLVHILTAPVARMIAAHAQEVASPVTSPTCQCSGGGIYTVRGRWNEPLFRGKVCMRSGLTAHAVVVAVVPDGVVVRRLLAILVVA
jgi:hypothetical protein